MSTKVEYQEDLGAEEMSVTEITNEWMDLLIRPASYLIRGIMCSVLDYRYLFSTNIDMNYCVMW